MAGVLNSFWNVAAPVAGVTLVGFAYSYTATSGMSYPAGAQAGDVAIFTMIGTGPSSGSNPTGYSGGVNVANLGTGYGGAASSKKVLNSGDISGGVTGVTQNGPAMVAVYRGATNAVLKSYKSPNIDADTGVPVATTALSTSYTKTGGSLKEVSHAISSDTSGTFTAPGTTRNASNYYKHSDFDPSDYTSGDFLALGWPNTAVRVFWTIWELT